MHEYRYYLHTFSGQVKLFTKSRTTNSTWDRFAQIFDQEQVDLTLFQSTFLPFRAKLMDILQATYKIE